MANEISSATRSVSAPPKPPAPERNRTAEVRAEQDQQQQRIQQRQAENNKPKEPVLNTQGQTTGRIVNVQA